MQFVAIFTDFTNSYDLRLDVMTSVRGLENENFKNLIQEATIVISQEVPVYFLDYVSLIRTKKACNRLKDQLDIKELNKLNNRNLN